MVRFLSLKISAISVFCFLLFFPFLEAYAAAGCCSHHGGVSGCNTATNYVSCKDGTTSPSCLCGGGKTKATKTKTKKTTTTTSTTPVTTTTTSTTTAASKTKSKTTGCCSRHGGVASCDKASGYQLCKDGTRSTTCKC